MRATSAQRRTVEGMDHLVLGLIAAVASAAIAAIPFALAAVERHLNESIAKQSADRR